MSAATPGDGPRVVVIGGGHGAAAALRAVRRFTDRITAVISVADDGGSSGRLREVLDVVALGDLRKCLVALADPHSEAEGLLARALEHRFDGAGELSGHAVGNLLLAGMSAAAGGDLQEALDTTGRLVGARGRVVPATTERVVLRAEVEGGDVAGQVAVGEAGRIRRVSLVPAAEDAEEPSAGDPSAGDPSAGERGREAICAPAEALEALRAADLVVIGPGSLYTSVLAALVVPGIPVALAECRGRRAYVCNLAPELPETSGYDVAAHLAALTRHGIGVDVVLCDTSAGLALGCPDRPVVDRPLRASVGRAHDPAKLASALSDLLG